MEKNYINFGNFVDMIRLPFFQIVFGTLSLPKLLSDDDFSSIGGSGKGVYESKSGSEFCENCGQDGWKLDSG